MSRGDTSGLEVKVTEGERCRRTLEVSVPADFVDQERLVVTRKYASRMKLKGFRKGRVPPGVIARRFGPVIEDEAVEQAVRKACDEAISTRELRPVADVDVTDVRFKPGDPLTFKAVFDAWPEVPTGRLGGFRVERPRVEVPQGAVERIIERLRGEQAVWHAAENGRPEPGNAVSVVMTRLDGEEGDGPGDDGDASRQYDLILGEGQALPDIEDAIRGLTIGEEGDFDVTFPDDFPDETRRGARHRVRISLLSRSVPRLPEVDDAFARSVGDFEDLDELRNRVGEDLEKEARSRAETEVNDRVLRMVVEANPFEVPESMVERYTDAVLREAQDMEPEQLEGLREELRPASEFAVRRDLLVSRITEEHGLRASSDEVGAQLEAVARERGEPAGRVRARLRKSGALETIERRLTDAKLIRFLREQSEITEAS